MSASDVPLRSRVGSLALARWWAAKGFPCIPVSQGLDASGKWIKAVPLQTPQAGGPIPPDAVPGLRRGGPHSGGFHQASCDPGFLSEIIDSGYLVGTPGRQDICVIDVDDPATFDEWAASLGDLWTAFEASTFVVQTRDDGRRHVYLRLPTGSGIRKVDINVPGGEAKGFLSREGYKDGFWLLPGQDRPDGHGSYLVRRGTPDGISLASPPLLATLRAGAAEAPPLPPRGAGRRTVPLRPSTFVPDVESPADVLEGGRNEYLFTEACRLIRGGLDDFDALLRILNALNAGFPSPHDADEVRRAAESAWQQVTVEADSDTPDTQNDQAGDTEADQAGDDGDRTSAIDEDANARRRRRGEREVLPMDIDGFCTAIDALGTEVRWNLRESATEIDRGYGWELQTTRVVHAVAEAAAGRFSTDEAEPLKRRPWRPGGLIYQFLDVAAERNEVDPFLSWLEALPAWDGRTRLDHVLARVFPPGDDANIAIYAWASRMPLVAACRRAIMPGTAFPHMVTLVGVDRQTHTRYWHGLLPREWVRPVDLRDNLRNQAQAVIGPVIADVYGFADTRRAGQALRHLVTATEDIKRSGPADGARCPRRCALVSATPDENFIPSEAETDDLCVPIDVSVTPAGLDGLPADRDQIWAEAVVAARRGEGLELPTVVADVALHDAVASRVKRTETTYEQIREWLLPRRIGVLPMDEILTRSGVKHKFEGRMPHSVLLEAGKALRSMGWRKVVRQGRKVWIGPAGESMQQQGTVVPFQPSAGDGGAPGERDRLNRGS